MPAYRTSFLMCKWTKESADYSTSENPNTMDRNSMITYSIEIKA